MPKTIEAVYEDGVFKPLKKIRFKEHERVELSILKKSEVDEMSQKALSMIGIGESGLKDTAGRHDEYLYGEKRHLLKRIKK